MQQTWMGNPTHRSVDYRQVGPAERPSIAWSRRFENSVGGFSIRDNTIYAPVGKSIVSIGTDGTGRWRHTFSEGYSVNTVPAVVDDTVYIGTTNLHENTGGRVYALDADTGVTRWTFDKGRVMTIGDDRVGLGDVQSVLAAVDDLVYVGDSKGNFYALDTVSGKIEWVYRVSGAIRMPPALVNGTVYFADTDGDICALDMDTGDSVMACNIDAHPSSFPTVVDGTVYVGTFSDSLFALDSETGRIRWTHDVGITPASTAVADGSVYVGGDGGGDGGYVCSLDSTLGTRQWTTDIDCHYVVADDDTIYVTRHGLHALHPDTGAERWCFDFDTERVLQGFIVADGDVYLSSTDAVGCETDHHHLHELEGSRSNTVLCEDGTDSEAEGVTRVYHPCPACGTNLDGHGDPNFCPECGADL